jgi:hypothetical protein
MAEQKKKMDIDMDKLQKVIYDGQYPKDKIVNMLKKYTYWDDENINYVYDMFKKPITLKQITQIKFAKRQVARLPFKWVDNREKWLKVGYVLKNISLELLDTWIEFSKRSDKYEEGECEKLWPTFKDNNYTTATLCWMIKN